MAISVNVDLSGCKVAFLTVTGNRLDGLLTKAIQELLDRGVKHVKTITMEEASLQLAKTQKRHNAIPAGQRFLKVTSKGNIVQLFF